MFRQLPVLVKESACTAPSRRRISYESLLPPSKKTTGRRDQRHASGVKVNESPRGCVTRADLKGS